MRTGFRRDDLKQTAASRRERLIWRRRRQALTVPVVDRNQAEHSDALVICCPKMPTCGGLEAEEDSPRKGNLLVSPGGDP